VTQQHVKAAKLFVGEVVVLTRTLLGNEDKVEQPLSLHTPQGILLEDLEQY
jgi:hypothetical protein